MKRKPYVPFENRPSPCCVNDLSYRFWLSGEGKRLRWSQGRPHSIVALSIELGNRAAVALSKETVRLFELSEKDFRHASPQAPTP